jgi:rhodanese-related sulfurtransferase
MTRSIDARALKRAIRDGREIAILDVREEADYFPRHLLFASCVPFGRIEILIDDLLPRHGTRIVITDGGEGLSSRAAERLAVLGYGNVSILEGGIDAWAAEGYEVFGGMHVPSKAFGELVEEQCGTPRMPPEEIKRRLDAGEDIVILDSRPFEEYRRQSIPGGIDCPGAELAYRVHDLVRSRDTIVVVNCAGRTRSIIGAQSLLNAGIPNRVFALKDGTMGWHLAGLPLAKGEARRAPDPTPAGLAKAQASASRVADAACVGIIDRATYTAWTNEREERTLYVFDVRGPKEFESGHLPEAVSAPGGQLVQETDRYAATRHARVVLVDDTGVRARMTGAWLRQMGWREVAVLENALSGQTLVTGKRRGRVLGLEETNAVMVEPAALERSLAAGEAVVLDFANIRRHRAGHIPGSFFAIRANLPGNVARLPSRDGIYLTSSDGVVARFAADQVAAAVGRPVKVLAGGTGAWTNAGFPLEKGCTAFIDEPRDLWSPYERSQSAEANMKAYLNWEAGLTRQIERDGDADFRIMRPPDDLPA